jgi:hypothetical protein
MKEKNWILYFLCAAGLMLSGCNTKKGEESPLFQVLDSQRTGLNFSNNLRYSPQFNLFKYMYFYNGSGIGAGDFNGAGKIDLFFSSNQEQNKLYINGGSLKFKDVTKEAAIPQDGGWSTGVSVVDINNDGLLDIYVCRVGQYETLHSKNQFLINHTVKINFSSTRVLIKMAYPGLSTKRRNMVLIFRASVRRQHFLITITTVTWMYFCSIIPFTKTTISGRGKCSRAHSTLCPATGSSATTAPPCPSRVEWSTHSPSFSKM